MRALGYASTIDELEEGLAGVSVGVVDDARTLLGTIDVSGLARRFDEAGRAGAVEPRARSGRRDRGGAAAQRPLSPRDQPSSARR